MHENYARIELSGVPRSASLFPCVFLFILTRMHTHTHTHTQTRTRTLQSLESDITLNSFISFLMFYLIFVLSNNFWIYRVPLNVLLGNAPKGIFISERPISIYFSALFFSHCLSTTGINVHVSLLSARIYIYTYFSSLKNPWRKLSVSFVLRGLGETGFCDVQSGAAKNKISSRSLLLRSPLSSFLSLSLVLSLALFLSTFFRLSLFLDFYSPRSRAFRFERFAEEERGYQNAQCALDRSLDERQSPIVDRRRVVNAPL